MTRLQEIDSGLIESVCARVRERLGEDEAPHAEEFIRQYYRRVPPEDLADLDPLDLYGAALAHWSFARKRAPGAANVRVYNPDFEQHGWQSAHTVVELVSDDMPFLVDSTTMELSGQDAGIHLLIHPVMRVRRDAGGELTAVLPADAPDEDDTLAESFIRVEIDRVSDSAELQRLRERLLDILRQVAAAVDDWRAMRAHATDLIAELHESPASLDRDELDEAAELLAWMDDGHFTFLGFAEYELVARDGEDRLRRVAGSGLGILRDPTNGKPPSESKLSARASALAREPHPLVLTKANSRSTVHRPAYLDYVGVKRFGADGEVVGERRFLGLYTTAAYRAVASDIPVLRRKVEAVIARAGYPPASHAEKALVEILDTYPRDELFQIPEDELFELAMGILALGERQRVRLFTRRDTLDRFVSCLVFLPRDRFHTRNRERIQEILAEAFDAEARRLRAAPVGVGARAHPLHGAAQAGARAGPRPGRDRGADRRGHRLVDRRAARGAARGGRRGAGHRAVPPLRRRVPGRLPRRLGRTLGGGRHPADRAPRRGRAARGQPVPPAGGGRRARCAASCTVAASR